MPSSSSFPFPIFSVTAEKGGDQKKHYSTLLLLHRGARYELSHAPCNLEKRLLEQDMKETSVPFKQCLLEAAVITPHPACSPSLPFAQAALTVHTWLGHQWDYTCNHRV